MPISAWRESAPHRPFTEFCDRHIDMNTRTLEELRQALSHAESEVNTASPFPERG
jgi:hypothetical protein